MKEEKVLKALWGSPETPLKIGKLEIPCYVLEDERRVLSGRGMQDALALGQSHGSLLKNFLASDSVKPFIDSELAMVLDSPIKFIRPGRGGKTAMGYEATVLVDICHAIMDAKKADHLSTKKQILVAEQCDILTRAFSKVGIIALVDEATGFQEIRNRQALEKILDKYIRKELGKWAKRFPNEFYEQMFRIRGWPYNPVSVKRPGYIGTLTRNIVYERLEIGVVEELERKNPATKGRRKTHHHRWLTEDIGHTRLQEHLTAVMALMRATPDGKYQQFERLLNRAFPKCSDTLELLLETEKGVPT